MKMERMNGIVDCNGFAALPPDVRKASGFPISAS
jgi:hypothetical protein